MDEAERPRRGVVALLAYGACDGGGIGTCGLFLVGEEAAVLADRAVPAAVAPLPARPAGAVAVEGGEGIAVEARHMGQRAVPGAPLADDDRYVLGARIAGDGVLIGFEPVCRGVVVAAGFHRGVVEVRGVDDLGVVDAAEAGGQALADDRGRFDEQSVVAVGRADRVRDPLVHRGQLLGLDAVGGCRKVLALAEPPHGLVDQVVAEHGRVVGEALGEHAPHTGLRPLEVTVLVEVLEGRLHGGLEVLREPVVRMRGEGQPVGAGRPLGYAAMAERGPEDVLVGVEDDADAPAVGPVRIRSILQRAPRARARLRAMGAQAAAVGVRGGPCLAWCVE